MILSIKPFSGTSKEGKSYNCFKLVIGDFEHLIFPRGNMESKYLDQALGQAGIECELK